MKVGVVIPTYNESATIASIIKQVLRQDRKVIVVDDGSTDATAQISANSGAITLKNPQNRGKGYSLARGLKYVINNDFDAAVILDGDGQHNPLDIAAFIEKAQRTDAGIVIGNRMNNPRSMPLIRVLTNKLLSWLISKLTRQHIPDTQCGFRLIKRELIEKLGLNSNPDAENTRGITTRRFETESEILILASRLGYRIESTPIKSVYQKEKSAINPVVDTLRFIIFILRSMWNTKS